MGVEKPIQDTPEFGPRADTTRRGTRWGKYNARKLDVKRPSWLWVTRSDDSYNPSQGGRSVFDLKAHDEDEATNSGKWSHWLTTRSHAVVRRTC